MVSDKLRYDLDFTRLLINHTKKTLAKDYIDSSTKKLLTDQLERLEFQFEKLKEQLPKKKNATPTP